MVDGERQTIRVKVTGHVQGVGFRAWTRKQARMLDLAGWVRNENDGSVSALFQGGGESLQQMLKCLRAGPAGATISRIEREEDGDAAIIHGFEVRY